MTFSKLLRSHDSVIDLELRRPGLQTQTAPNHSIDGPPNTLCLGSVFTLDIYETSLFRLWGTLLRTEVFQVT